MEARIASCPYCRETKEDLKKVGVLVAGLVPIRPSLGWMARVLKHIGNPDIPASAGTGRAVSRSGGGTPGGIRELLSSGDWIFKFGVVAVVLTATGIFALLVALRLSERISEFRSMSATAMPSPPLLMPAISIPSPAASEEGAGAGGGSSKETPSPTLTLTPTPTLTTTFTPTMTLTTAFTPTLTPSITPKPPTPTTTDAGPPNVAVSYEPTGASKPNKNDTVTFTARANDDLGVVRIEIWVRPPNTELFTLAKTCERTTICVYQGGPYKPGYLDVVAGAWDAEGNEGVSDQVQVTIYDILL